MVQVRVVSAIWHRLTGACVIYDDVKVIARLCCRPIMELAVAAALSALFRHWCPSLDPLNGYFEWTCWR